jgi:FKBP-type peptidyl-prolyl cis-trans isomerase (trigger factor)
MKEFTDEQKQLLRDEAIKALTKRMGGEVAITRKEKWKIDADGERYLAEELIEKKEVPCPSSLIIKTLSSLLPEYFNNKFVVNENDEAIDKALAELIGVSDE